MFDRISNESKSRHCGQL